MSFSTNAGKNGRRRRPARRRGMRIETLESRQLLAAGLAADPLFSLYDYDGDLLSNWRDIAADQVAGR